MEQMTVSVTKYKEHSEEVYQAWKDVWNEYSKEFVETTGVKYHWAYQEQEDCVYYVAVNMFPSKEARDKWIDTYDDDAGTKEFQRLFEEKMGKRICQDDRCKISLGLSRAGRLCLLRCSKYVSIERSKGQMD